MALAAQGLDKSRPDGGIDGRHVRRIIQRLGLLQLDYVNVLIPAHYQVLFSRLGAYPLSLLEKTVYLGTEFTEQWAHEASIIPMEIWPLLRDRMENHRLRPWGFEEFMAANADFVDSVLRQVRERGPLGADEVDVPPRLPKRSIGGAWSRSTARCVLEAFFGKGILGVTSRRRNFARRYDLVERVIPEQVLQQAHPVEEAHRRLLLRAARGLGVGTTKDLSDYYRMSARETRPRLEELVDMGKLKRGQVEGWSELVFIHPEARIPRSISAQSLLSPFDPLIWCRPRVARLFDFDYRLEIFVPAAKRRWGYYVLPFLLGERLVARVDIKADRKEGRLLVLAGYVENHADPSRVAPALAGELRAWASWLELASIHIEPSNPFMAELDRELS